METRMSEYNGTPTIVNSNPISWAKPCHVYHPPVTIGGLFTIPTWVVYCFTHSFVSRYIHCYWNSTSRRNPPFFSQCYGLQNPGPGGWQLVTISNNEIVQKHCKSLIFLRNEPPVLVKGFAHPPDPIIIIIIIIIINHH